MELQTFFDSFEIMAEAPNGIDELRELIFRLALSGKVVPQEASEGSGEDLRSSLAKERTELETKGQLKKRKSLGDPKPSDRLFEIPSSWDWAYLNEVGDWGSGSTPSRSKSEYYSDEGMPWLKSGELNDSYVNEAEEFVTKKALAECSLRINKPGDVLMAMYGATVGKLAILEFEATTNQAVCACSCFPGVYNRYLFLSLRGFRRVFIGQGAGGAQPNISRVKIVSTAIPLPPLEEQKRIVAKVDQLMALCDELEEKKKKRNKYRVRANEASLDKLLNAQEPEEFEEHWQRVVENFDKLYLSDESLNALQAASLHFAAFGKLSTRSSSDTPACSLLKSISSSREDSLRSGNVKKLPKSSKISADGLVNLPKGWEWTKIGVVAEKVTDGEHSTPRRTESGNYLLSARNVTNKGIDLSKVDYVPDDEFERLRRRCDPNIGDVLISCSGSIGRVALVDKDDTYVMVRSAAMIRSFPEFLLPEFLVLVLRSPFLQKQMVEKSRSTAQANLFLGKICELVLPIAPLQEQERICKKIAELSLLLSKLRSSLNACEKVGERFSRCCGSQLGAAYV